MPAASGAVADGGLSMNTAIKSDAKDIKSLIRNAEALGDEFIAALAALKIKILASRAHPDIVPHEDQPVPRSQ
jgi:hypothetical protein